MTEEIRLDKNKKHNIEVVVDRLVIKEDMARRLTDSVEIASNLSGGLVVVPDDMDVEDFTAVQHPADAEDADTITTHFEYHCMEDNLLKLDMLGHDDPTMIRMLQDLTGVDPQKIPLDDRDTMTALTRLTCQALQDQPKKRRK